MTSGAGRIGRTSFDGGLAPEGGSGLVRAGHDQREQRPAARDHGRNDGKSYVRTGQCGKREQEQQGSASDLAQNVIYMLIDTKNKLLYVGEAQDLVKRLSQPYPTIKDWDYFRYNVLPDKLAPYRVVLERMLIRDFASLLKNKKDVKCISISDYSLANDKIDT